MAGEEEISLVNFKMLKALCLSIRLGKDGTQFRNAVAGLADVDACLARVNDIVGRHEISDGEANAYIEDMLEDMGIPETAVKDEPPSPSLPDFGHYRSPCSSPASADPKNPSITTDGRNGSDVSVADALHDMQIEDELPDFGDEQPPTPVEVMVARAMAVDNAGIRRPALELPAAKRPRLAAQAVAHDNEALGWKTMILLLLMCFIAFYMIPI